MDVMQTGIDAIRASWSFSDLNGFIYYQELGTHIVQKNRIERPHVIEGLMPGAYYSLYLAQTTTSSARVKAADLIYIGICILHCYYSGTSLYEDTPELRTLHSFFCPIGVQIREVPLYLQCLCSSCEYYTVVSQNPQTYQ